MTMKKTVLLAAAAALCLNLAACGGGTPSLEEVEAAIRDGSVTLEDALDKGWITQEWADSYLEAGSVPAADKVALNAVGSFETETLAGESFTNEDISGVVLMVFLDPEDAAAEDYYNGLVSAAEDIRAAGADILVCCKGSMDTPLFQDAPFPVVAYNESMQTALGSNDEMASGIPCTGVWYVNGSLLSAWMSEADPEALADSAESFVAMGEEQQLEDGQSQDTQPPSETSETGAASVNGNTSGMTSNDSGTVGGGATAPHAGNTGGGMTASHAGNTGGAMAAPVMG